VSDVSDVLERLTKHRTLSEAPPAQIEWVANHGYMRKLATGEILTAKQQPVAGLHIVLSGHFVIYVEQGSGKKKVMEWRGGDITGMMPYSRLVSPPGDVIAEEPSEVFVVECKHLPQMIRECYELTGILVHIMLDRARIFQSSYLHDEKMVSLGKLAAGLAHELNNPASALTRSAKAVSASVGRLQSASHALGAAGLSKEQFALIDDVRKLALESKVNSIRSPLDQEAREDAITQWLRQHDADLSAAEPLAETDISLAVLDRLATVLGKDMLDPALCWIASDFATSRLTQEIQIAAGRVYDLVSAVKGFTQMDRAGVSEPVDVGVGLSSTAIVLGSKARSKSISLDLKIEPNLPRVNGFGGELNQVWSNLIDNALDAVGQNGHVETSAVREGNHVVVRVIDDGTGIPEEIRNRIFDPFFTTKPVGSGTGLGLDIVRKLIRRHNGEIDVESVPGRTEFRVRLPISPTVGAR
jgi:signal transduction histidine kinase